MEGGKFLMGEIFAFSFFSSFSLTEKKRDRGRKGGIYLRRREGPLPDDSYVRWENGREWGTFWVRKGSFWVGQAWDDVGGLIFRIR